MPKREGPNSWAPEADKPVKGPGAPSVGQRGKPFQGENARGQSQPRTNSSTSAGGGADSGPRHEKGWPAKSPSNRY